MIEYFQFTPDLIVEATSVCDRACVGCYAPNVVSQESAQSLYLKQPGLFLSPDAIEKALRQFDTSLGSIAIRGGEPTRHPELASIIRSCSKNAERVYVETHGRWLLPEAIRENKNILSVIEETKAIVKVSFDQMHGLSSNQLSKITDFLSWNDISYYVAITENNAESFKITRSRCAWISDEKIIYQLKARQNNELVRPQFGVLGVDGKIMANLNSKMENPNRGLTI